VCVCVCVCVSGVCVRVYEVSSVCVNEHMFIRSCSLSACISVLHLTAASPSVCPYVRLFSHSVFLFILLKTAAIT
jgi:hypothetical protein